MGKLAHLGTRYPVSRLVAAGMGVLTGCWSAADASKLPAGVDAGAQHVDDGTVDQSGPGECSGSAEQLYRKCSLPDAGRNPAEDASILSRCPYNLSDATTSLEFEFGLPLFGIGQKVLGPTQCDGEMQDGMTLTLSCQDNNLITVRFGQAPAIETIAQLKRTTVSAYEDSVFEGVSSQWLSIRDAANQKQILLYASGVAIPLGNISPLEVREAPADCLLATDYCYTTTADALVVSCAGEQVWVDAATPRILAGYEVRLDYASNSQIRDPSKCVYGPSRSRRFLIRAIE